MVYLGIDTSVNSMPFAVFENKELKDFGILSVKGKYLEEKLAYASREIEDLIYLYEVDVVVLEDVFLAKNFTSTKNTLQMMGALRLSSYKSGATCFTVMATQWRKGVIKQGKREPMKKQAIEYVNEMYDLDLEYDHRKTKTQDDIAEAIIMIEGLVWQRYTLDKVKIFKDKVGDKHGRI